jgi:hypothetical protein
LARESQWLIVRIIGRRAQVLQGEWEAQDCGDLNLGAAPGQRSHRTAPLKSSRSLRTMDPVSILKRQEVNLPASFRPDAHRSLPR